METDNETTQFSRSGSHRSRSSRHSRHSRNSGVKIWALSLALLIAIVVMFIAFVYAGSRIEELSSRAGSLQEQLFLKEKEADALTSNLAQAEKDLEGIVKGRLPSVINLVPDKVLAVNNALIKNIVFTVVTQDGAKHYEYKLVVENHGSKSIVPKFSLLIFDRYGVQIGMDQVLTGEDLAPGESRSYSSKIEFTMHEQPAYFQVSSMSPSSAEPVHNTLK